MKSSAGCKLGAGGQGQTIIIIFIFFLMEINEVQTYWKRSF